MKKVERHHTVLKCSHEDGRLCMISFQSFFQYIRVCVIFYTEVSLSLSFHSHDNIKEFIAVTTLCIEALSEFFFCNSFNKLDHIT